MKHCEMCGQETPQEEKEENKVPKAIDKGGILDSLIKMLEGSEDDEQPSRVDILIAEKKKKKKEYKEEE